MADGARGGKEPLEVILAFYAAVRDGRAEDMLALVDREVTCHPLVRPGLSTYYGHGGMIELASDMHTVHGDYSVDIDKVIEEDGSKITVRATIHPKAGHGSQPLTVTTTYSFRDGLIYSIESHPGS